MLTKENFRTRSQPYNNEIELVKDVNLMASGIYSGEAPIEEKEYLEEALERHLWDKVYGTIQDDLLEIFDYFLKYSIGPVEFREKMKALIDKLDYNSIKEQ